MPDRSLLLIADKLPLLYLSGLFFFFFFNFAEPSFSPDLALATSGNPVVWRGKGTHGFGDSPSPTLPPFLPVACAVALMEEGGRERERDVTTDYGWMDGWMCVCV